MKNRIRSPVLLLAALALVAGLGAVVAFAENIDPFDDSSQYAWGENVGWLNAEPSGDGGPGVQVYDTNLGGWMWGENIGWVSLCCANTASCGTVDYCVDNDGAGNLAGWAWGENIGWVSFSCDYPGTCGNVDYRVTVDPVTGVFSGYAWSENRGWISFSDDAPTAYQVQTSWACAGAAIDNGPGIAADDVTVPNSPGLAGCVHDGDLDNDGLPDVSEEPLVGCGAFHGTPSGHPNPAGGDITNDDDHDGEPAPPMGSDGSDNGPSWDTDNDGVMDGTECSWIPAYNPRDAASTPPCTDPSGDADGDGLLDNWEACKWGTLELNTNTDGDTLGDCVEAADVNGDGVVDFVGDVIYYAKAALLPTASYGQTMDFDINGDGAVDFVGDVIQEAKFALIPGLCQ